MVPVFKLGIDWGEKSLGIALSSIEGSKNTIVYTAVLEAEEKWLKEKVSRRNEEKRLRRTRKSKKKRQGLIKKALVSLTLDDHLKSFILSFCRRRGFDYTEKDEDDTEERRYSVHRTKFLEALSKELESRCPSKAKEIIHELQPILNRQIRPKRFLNKNTSKCQWEGCTQNTSKKTNSRKETLILALYPKFQPFLATNDIRATDSTEIASMIDAFIKDAVDISKLPQGKQPDKQDNLKEKIKKFRKDLRSLVTNKQRFEKVWKKGKVHENIKNIVLETPKGRQTFCRKHVEKYREFFLDGKIIPKRQVITESDLTRRQEILFSKLYAFIKGRILPLTRGHGIAEITVERNAFDVVPRKYRPHMEKGKKKGLSEDKLSELYWCGPKYGFKNEKEMFYEEFGGRCAYCYKRLDKATYHIEHMFNQADFPMDGYLNKVPSCPECNRKKGPRTITRAKMPIHPKAYEAYERYLEGKKPRHFLMDEKKGILNLLRDVNGGFWGEQPESNFGPFTEHRLIQVLGRGMVSQARTQTSSRMLARYLATKLECLTGCRPEIEPFNSRYVAHIRNRFCPDFSKDIERRHGHALDAAILSCRWPSPNIPSRGSDGRERWEFDTNWNERVEAAFPRNIGKDGAVELPGITPIQGFEETLKRGGFFVNLSNTNWNQREVSVADQTIYSLKSGKPTVRKPAREWFEDFLKKKDPEKHIRTVVHSGLRTLLLDKFKKTGSRDDVGKVLKGWLRKTVKAGLKGQRPVHPSSQARWKELQEFINGAEDIPPTIGLRLFQEEGREGSPDIRRLRDGDIVHFQMAHPSFRYFIVAYSGERPDKQGPLVLGVKQSWRVLVKYGPRGKVGEIRKVINSKACLKDGRQYRGREKEGDFLKRWQKELDEFLDEINYRQYYRIRQGNVVLYEDGSHSQIKNFKIGENISKKTFCNIRRVYSSPYNFLLKNVCESGKNA